MATGELNLQHIGVRFGGLVALDDVSLRVAPGKVVGVIGPNGAGKTTLFNVISGFVAPSEGSITLDGKPWRPRPHRLSGLGIARTLQGVGQFGGMTVLENVMVGVRGRRAEAEAFAALDRCGVAQYAAVRPGTLPYAIRKRVELARALASKPRILMLDEPAGGLDTDEIRWLGDLIKNDLVKNNRAENDRAESHRTENDRGDSNPSNEAGTTVLLVEHHMDLVMSVCDEILVLDFGKPIALGTPSEISTNERVTEAYLGAPA
ncbi:ABC transporter ATP-binding protein [Actinoplanes sp. CA-015351]|uniref:ABC transporter ATP-binding protein n=1 Tax=Actinoplanes sp. CA-015351 TaxID=3239897 RepID=UPI003D97CE10